MTEMTELDSLKEIATNKGIEFHPNIGVDKLKAKIQEFDEKFDKKVEKKAEPASTTKMAARKEQELQHMKLIRCRIACMNPAKREWQGEYLSVGNAVLGFHTKYVLFDYDYHLTSFMIETLKAKKFRMSKEVPDGKGGKIRKNFFPAEYNIEILPPLTQEEIDALAADQAKRGAIEK